MWTYSQPSPYHSLLLPYKERVPLRRTGRLRLQVITYTPHTGTDHPLHIHRLHPMILPFHLLMYNPRPHVPPPPSPVHPRPQHVLDCEFYLLEMMDCCLIVHQPYRPLTTYAESLGPEVTSSHHIRHTSHTPHIRHTSHTPHI